MPYFKRCMLPVFYTVETLDESVRPTCNPSAPHRFPIILVVEDVTSNTQ